MHKFYFPSCKIDGPIEPPAAYNLSSITGAVPLKCSKCSHLFEGSCTRGLMETNHYLYLDHGACRQRGPTDPVVFTSNFIESKVEVPRKCADCIFMKLDNIYGFYCDQDRDQWGAFKRSLDWGAWEPNSIYLELPPPKITTRELSRHAKNNNQLAFIKEYRRANPDLSLSEAIDDFSRLRDILEENLKR